MPHIICPKCANPLFINNKSYVCQNNHTYDIAKEGYANLLQSNKSGSLIGDNKDMAVSRRDFLSKGYFNALADALKEEANFYCNESSTAVDICCGEGYYTNYIAESSKGEFLGFDISREMIRLAAKRRGKASFFVANMKALPVASNSIDFATHLFAPFCESEFNRILSKDGVFISVSPGKRHLFSLKELLYDTAYENEESVPDYSSLVLIEQKRITDTITLDCEQDILSLFKMTPYYYHTSEECKARLNGVSSLTTQLDFVVNIFKKAEN